MRKLIKDLSSCIWEQINVQWFLHNRVAKKSFWFLTLRDRSGLGMIIVEWENQMSKLDGMQIGTILSIDGTVFEEPNNKKFGLEIKNVDINVLQAVSYANGIDISKDDLNLEMETMIDNRIFTLRHPKQSSIFKIYANVERSIRAFMDSNDFTQINTPKIIWFATEWWAEVFDFDYFEKKACLAQSPQFYKQIMAAVYERVYEIGKAYRAEKSNSSRHISEILMLDVEMWFIDFEFLMWFISDMLRNVCESTWSNSSSYLELLGSTKPILPEKFPRISVSDLHNMYFEASGEDLRWEWDISSAEEKFICEYSAANRWSDAVIITWFAWSDAKFYHIQNSENPLVAERADLLFRGVEVSTLTMRQTDYDKLISQIKNQWIDPTNPWLLSYLDAFKYGMPKTWWFGFGITRLVQKIIWLSNVKEAELFPRDRNRLTP